ncbi:HD-GYP domain-containing protein [Salipaludibacillus keqinensis]|nr:HD-GYP domain-containing protein [Salipaludibacillus keqinensis]
MELVERKNWGQSIVGRILADDIISSSGYILLRKGVILTHWHFPILENHLIEEVLIEEKMEAPVHKQLEKIFSNKRDILESYQESLIEIKKMFHEAISREVPTLQQFMKPFSPLLHKVLKGPNIFLELRHIKGHDEYTYRHSINVGLMAATIGKILHFTHENTIKLGEIGFLHDIGKMKISLQILNKQESLSIKEFEEVKNHTIYGKQMLEDMQRADQKIIEGALLHHERLDGSGYPLKLVKEQIPFFVQILSVADTYDAISSERVYRDKFSPFEALNELIKDVYRGKLNGEIVFPFVKHILDGYIGKEVMLTDGRRGVIVQLYIEEIYRPLIKISDQFVDLRKDRQIQIKEVLLTANHLVF